ncbi:MAG: UDP-N-acetylmuramate--L-alanine ligase [Candidatus Nealsonbacteria bacterium]|nr:UDP-N-acetylmuramate--L-alanine ligase [Candidatus Nealsonbacteria bacterium]
MKIHLIGIGGIGVSALAQYYLSQGHEVTGSDLTMSEITDYLQKLGVKITKNKSLPAKIPHKMPDLVVYSPAVKKTNPELAFYLKKKIKCLSYPEALGGLTKNYFTIAVSGAHGKSTTTAMLGLILIKAKLDPTIIVGTKLKEFGGANFRPGKSKYLVIEACEYDSSFLHYVPQMVVVTNIDKEHLDYFKNLKNVIAAFMDFIARLPDSGALVANGDDKNMQKILLDKKFQAKSRFKISGFRIKSKEADIVKNILNVPGIHNVYNALAALTAAKELKIDDDVVLKSLSEYKGSWRRFEEKEKIINGKKIKIINDYGHHPTEIEATFEAARQKYPDRKIWCVFQPHQHQRTFNLFNDFVKTFQSALIDNIVIIDIYDVAGRETKKIKRKVSSKSLVKKINKKSVSYASMVLAEKKVKKNIKSGDVLIIMGAGDIYEKFASRF